MSYEKIQQTPKRINLYSFNFDLLSVSVDNFHSQFGGKAPGVNRVIFSNGLLDTKFSHGITEYENNDSIVINIPGK